MIPTTENKPDSVNFLNLYKEFISTEDDNRKLNQEVIKRYYNFVLNLMKCLEYHKKFYKKQVAKILVNDEVRNQISKKVSDDALRKKTEQARKIYQLFDAIDEDKMQTIKQTDSCLYKFFDQLIAILLSDKQSTYNKNEAKKSIVGLYYIMAKIKNKFANRFKLESKSSSWNIVDFLEECDLEPYRKKIEEYLLSLETIVKMEKDQRRENAQKLLDKYKQAISEPSHKESVGTQGSQPDSKKAKIWEKERSRKQVHIHQPTITTDISGNMGNITAGTISGGTLVCESKRSHEGDEQTKQALLNKRTKIDDYFPVTLSPCEPPHTPPHRIFPRGSSSGASNSQIVLEEIRKIIENIKGIKYRLFDYRIINLSEQNVTNPVNKLSKSKKCILKDIWNSLESSQKIKTIHLDKWEKVLIPLIQKYQTYLENKSVFDVISLDSAIDDVLEKLYVRPFIHKEHHDLLWDGIYFINVNATSLEVGFLKVVGSTLYNDIKKLSEDTKKLF
ncbi:7277_t:CDS:2, partial [Cetraspora pellucida]